MFLLNGRKRAMSAVLTLTDGKPSFLFNTYEKVMQLKDKHVKLFFSPVTEFEGEELALMKKWASSPWEKSCACAWSCAAEGRLGSLRARDGGEVLPRGHVAFVDDGGRAGDGLHADRRERPLRDAGKVARGPEGSPGRGLRGVGAG